MICLIEQSFFQRCSVVKVNVFIYTHPHLLNINSGLKHVSDNQKTHKNPQLRSQAGPVQAGPKPFSAPRPTATATPARTLPPMLELEGKKWRVVSAKNCHKVELISQLLRRYPCVVVFFFFLPCFQHFDFCCSM